MRALAVIPARRASVRFPDKPLKLIRGRPLVQWVHEAAAACAHFERVIVATESREIVERVERFGGEAELTSDHHLTGTDRVAEVAVRHPWADVVANVQGDQPFVTAAQLDALLAPYLDGRAPEMTTVACPLRGDPADPNVVKVVCASDGRALYFSRSPIPYGAPPDRLLHHLGLYAFRSDFLRNYAQLPPSPLETIERLEQLRVLEQGGEIVVAVVPEPVLEVNTPADLERAEAMIAAR